ncbi:MAG: YfcZ/YiiS family protein [Shewanella sp.]|nr:YfcZ/YiiS family protein [Shewanella sp.]MCF1430938.1 YfcZ/YiiS family protein [Shewanella sp.]MCF1457080.1 YfcZ/YiiS family protein [Shewanella sp.]
MKSIKDAQSDLINDTCTCCGSFIDIGAVIEADDTELKLVLNGTDAQVQAQELADKAVNRFPNTQVAMTQLESGVELVLTFSVSAEKMIFQMSN